MGVGRRLAPGRVQLQPLRNPSGDAERPSAVRGRSACLTEAAITRFSASRTKPRRALHCRTGPRALRRRARAAARADRERVAAAGGDAGRLAAIDATEQAAIKRAREEVYVGFHELESLMPEPPPPNATVSQFLAQATLDILTYPNYVILMG